MYTPDTKKLSMPLGHDKIDCGIGFITYTAHNLQLKLLMETLETVIQKNGVLNTLSLLEHSK